MSNSSKCVIFQCLMLVIYPSQGGGGGGEKSKLFKIRCVASIRVRVEAVEAKCKTFQNTVCAIYPSQGGGGGGGGSEMSNFSKYVMWHLS